MKTKLLSLCTILVLIFAPALGCSRSSQGSNPTAAPSAQTVLYLCDRNDDSHTKILTSEICQLGATQDIVYPQYGRTPLEYEYTLPGDIQGTTYAFDLYLASGKSTTLEVHIVLKQGGKETDLASANLTATQSDFKSYSQEVTGVDPTTSKGDIIILRVIPAGGTDGAVLYTNDKTQTSYITIPSIK